MPPAPPPAPDCDVPQPAPPPPATARRRTRRRVASVNVPLELRTWTSSPPARVRTSLATGDGVKAASAPKGEAVSRILRPAWPSFSASRRIV